ncbi:hypothetical protein QZH41_019484, partial [Actinostola sp. cb2023]
EFGTTMWIKVRTFDGKDEKQIDNLSKLTKIEDLKERVKLVFEVDENSQMRLFFRGKQLENEHTLFDYNIGLNEKVQMMIQAAPTPSSTNEDVDDTACNGSHQANVADSEDAATGEEMNSTVAPENGSTPSLSVDQIGAKVDGKDLRMGAWFEAEVVDVILEDEADPTSVRYHVRFDEYEDIEISKLTARDVRPRARTRIQWGQLEVGQVVMANYSPDEPKERGFWYDMEITRKISKQITLGGAEARGGSGRSLYGKLLLGSAEGCEAPVAQECKLMFIDEIFKIENPPDVDENGQVVATNGNTVISYTIIVITIIVITIIVITIIVSTIIVITIIVITIIVIITIVITIIVISIIVITTIVITIIVITIIVITIIVITIIVITIIVITIVITIIVSTIIVIITIVITIIVISIIVITTIVITIIVITIIVSTIIVITIIVCTIIVITIIVSTIIVITIIVSTIIVITIIVITIVITIIVSTIIVISIIVITTIVITIIVITIIVITIIVITIIVSTIIVITIIVSTIIIITIIVSTIIVITIITIIVITIIVITIVITIIVITIITIIVITIIVITIVITIIVITIITIIVITIIVSTIIVITIIVITIVITIIVITIITIIVITIIVSTIIVITIIVITIVITIIVITIITIIVITIIVITIIAIITIVIAIIVITIVFKAACGGKENPDKQILCDECDLAYHIYCLDPPLEEIPDVDDWYCPLCKNDASEIINAGEKLRESKKKSKMVSASSSSNRDWGKGMACVGRTKICTIVPPNHFGPIPGMPVGSLWKFRVQVSESGIHRPHVSGIHGRDSEGAYSIVLAGGYEDDVDNGENFIYTGSGGRDLSGNKRTAEQSCDQQLTKMNRALARNCAAPLDDKHGGEAQDWKEGKPVRVVRSYKMAKHHSKYAPEEGNRYDGIYKVVKYWPEKGKSGFIVWRYLFRRDDKTPAPWTKEGKKLVKSIGIKMVYPEGFLEAQAKKEEEKGDKIKGKGKRKREKETASKSPSSSPVKKIKVPSISSEMKTLIDTDTENNKIWKELVDDDTLDYQKFHQKVEETFACICCQELVYKPITTTCIHNVCKYFSFQNAVLHPVSSWLRYRGYCPQLKYECGHTYGIGTDKLTTRHTRNEKLRTTKLDDPRLREPYLPKPNGDNKLTFNIVSGYTGYIPTVRFLYGSRYKEATEQAVSDFMKKDDKHRQDSDALKQTIYSIPKLKARPDFQDPTMYPDLKPRYSKSYFPSEQREFCEPPVPGYRGYVPRRREHELGVRYAVWSKDSFADSLTMRHKQEHLATQRIDVTRVPEATVQVADIQHGTLYKVYGMKPKYTGYIPQV